MQSSSSPVDRGTAPDHTSHDVTHSRALHSSTMDDSNVRADALENVSATSVADEHTPHADVCTISEEYSRYDDDTRKGGNDAPYDKDPMPSVHKAAAHMAEENGDGDHTKSDLHAAENVDTESDQDVVMGLANEHMQNAADEVDAQVQRPQHKQKLHQQQEEDQNDDDDEESYSDDAIDDDDDDEAVYLIGNVSSTAEAIDIVRQNQRHDSNSGAESDEQDGDDNNHSYTDGGDGEGSHKMRTRNRERDSVFHHVPRELAYFHDNDTYDWGGPDGENADGEGRTRFAHDLPSTLREFSERAHATASLIVARKAVLSDALDGFISEVQREKQERLRRKAEYVTWQNDLRRKMQEQQQNNTNNNNVSSGLTGRVRGGTGMQENEDDGEESNRNSTECDALAIRYAQYLHDQAEMESRLPHFIQHIYPSDVASKCVPPPRHRFDKEGVHVCAVVDSQNNKTNHNSSSTAYPYQINTLRARVRREWVFVWRQFVRDAPREVLLVERTPYSVPHEAAAAILGFLHGAFERGRRGCEERRVKEVELEQRVHALYGETDSNGNVESRDGQLYRRPARMNHGNFLLRALYNVGTDTLHSAVKRAQHVLPDFASAPLTVISDKLEGRDPLARKRAETTYPSNPCKRGAKIYEAAREVLLAAQQSFMAFPYQIVYEQVGMHRLASSMTAWGEHDSEEDSEGVSERRNGNEAVQPNENDVAEAKSSMDRISSMIDHNNNNISTIGTAPKSYSSASRGKCDERPLLIGEPSHRELRRFVHRVRACVRRAERRDALKHAGAAAKEAEQQPGVTTQSQDQFTAAARPGFREDVDGSVFLIPTHTAAFTSSNTSMEGGRGQENASSEGERVRYSSGSSAECALHPSDNVTALTDRAEAANSNRVVESSNTATPVSSPARTAEHPGTRIHLYFSSARGVPVVSVSKVFRLGTLPRNSVPRVNRGKSSRERQSVVMLLMQINFSLFSNDEVELRWRWYII